jgi:diadenosine tetraphosphatase ApaH/serine/threonine PP2A family protein phosphatase
VSRYALVSDIHANLPALEIQDRSDDFCLKMASPATLTYLGIVESRASTSLNSGSVGPPKDGDWRAGYVLLDLTQSGVGVEFVRVPYDVERAGRGIRTSGLPTDFGDQLRSGGAVTLPMESN